MNRNKRNACRTLIGKPEGKRQLGRPILCGRILLKWDVQRRDVLVWTGFICITI
jgi:hypothetical protein